MISPRCVGCIQREKKLVFLNRVLVSSFQNSEVYTGAEIREILLSKGVIRDE